MSSARDRRRSRKSETAAQIEIQGDVTYVGDVYPVSPGSEEDESDEEGVTPYRGVLPELREITDDADTYDDDAEVVAGPASGRRKSRKKSGQYQSAQVSARGRTSNVPPYIATLLRGLEDDIVDKIPEGADRWMEQQPQLLRSVRPDKVYIERGNQFVPVSWEKAFGSGDDTSLKENTVKRNSYKQPVGMPSLDNAIATQRMCHPFYILFHGMLAGFALFQFILMVINMTDSVNYTQQFIGVYFTCARSMQVIFLFLTIVTTVSILDRYDCAHMNFLHWADMFKYQCGGIFLILIFIFTLTMTAVTAKWDDRVAFYNNQTEFWTEPALFMDEVKTWMLLSCIRSAAAVIGWVGVVFCERDDLLLAHLISLKQFIHGDTDHERYQRNKINSV